MKFVHHSSSCSNTLGKLRWGSTAFLISLTSGFGANALAQSEEPQVSMLEEIVVTARRRDESMQDVPIAITALSEDFLEQNSIQEFDDLRTHVPSLSISVAGSSTNTPQVGLRGLRPMEVMITMDPAVPRYFDDVVLTPTHGSNLAMYDLAQVQVLKGPQGTLFGRNSTGGAMLIEPKEPGDEFGGYMKVQAGNYDMYSVEGAVDLPVSDKVQFRLAGRMLQRDGYQENVANNALNGQDHWDEDSLGARATMNVQFTDNLRNSLMVDYSENDMQARVAEPVAFNPYAQLGQLYDLIHNGALGAQFGPAAALLGIPTDPSIDRALERQAARDWQDVESDIDAREKVENILISNTTTWDLANGMTLKNIFGYRDLDLAAAQDVDGTAVPLFGTVTRQDRSVTLDPVEESVTGEQFSNELQLLGTAFDDRLDWVVGAYWFDQEGEENVKASQNVGANPDWPEGPSPDPRLASVWTIAQLGLVRNAPTGTADNESYALFAEGTYTLTDQWEITVGARQTWDERSVTVRNMELVPQQRCQVLDQSGARLPVDACERTVSEDFSSPTWRLSANYSFSDDVMAYGSVSTGYRAGGFNLRGVDNVTLEPFDEESVITYEAGHKGDWMLGNASLRTNFAVYLSEFEDIQKTQDVVVGTSSSGIPEYGTTTVNAAEAEIKGAELDILFAPTQNLDLRLAWSYVDAEYKEWLRPAQTPGNFIDVSDRPFIWIPEQSGTGSINYLLPLDPALGEISVMASVYWQDEVYTDDTVSNDLSIYGPEGGPVDMDVAQAFLDTEFADSYSVINLRADWRRVMGSSFDLAVFVNNVDDEDYVTGGLTVEDSLGYATRVYGPPRTYGASLNWTF